MSKRKKNWDEGAYKEPLRVIVLVKEKQIKV